MATVVLHKVRTKKKRKKDESDCLFGLVLDMDIKH